jgi:hypothetical protein
MLPPASIIDTCPTQFLPWIKPNLALASVGHFFFILAVVFA